jgi:2'-5' RNA ligase
LYNAGVVLRARLVKGDDMVIVMFELDTYIVLDMPPAQWTRRVTALRKRYDPGRTNMPVEITIIGSSGVGALENEQDANNTFNIIDELASRTDPITFRFAKIARFPGANLFYYEPADPAPFVILQEAIIATGLRFKPSPYPFTPHCTIVDLHEDRSERSKNELINLLIPSESITVDELRLYSLNGVECDLLYKTKMRARA